jgi:aminoglycoside phosphotransferase (APT) family kinase protein
VDEVAVALRRFLQAQLPHDAEPEISDLRRSGTGSSRENWPFDAVWQVDGQAREYRLLMRRDPATSVVRTAREAEFALLRMLSGTGLPVPEMLWLDAEGETLERPAMIVRRYDGAAHRAVLTAADPLGLTPGQRLRLARRMCDELARVHELDVDRLGLVEVMRTCGPNPAESELLWWEHELDVHELEPQPELRLAAAWMREHLPGPPPRTALVHGDFRPANMLILGGELELVLDWELAHLGDAAEDLGWYTAPIYAREHFIPGQWSQVDFLRRYRGSTGESVDHREGGALHFWQVLATFKLAVIALTGIRHFAEGTTDRPAAPADRVIGQVLAAIRTTPDA